MSLDETLKRQADFCGLTAWHEKGITGSGVVVWDAENLSEHGKTTRRRVLDAAPNATVINAPISAKYDGDSVEFAYVEYEGKKYELEDFIKEFNVKIITRSIAGGLVKKNKKGYYNLWRNLIDKYHLIVFNSAGNDGADASSNKADSDIAILVGAVYLKNNDDIIPTEYSSITDDVDFADFTGVWNGTSFSTPFLAGKAALMVQLYGDLTQEECYELMKSWCIDVHTEGVDNVTGNGVVIMGEPKTEIIMYIDNKVMTVNGKKVYLDQAPVINSATNRTLVPVRAISEALGCEVEWDAEERKITIIK